MLESRRKLKCFVQSNMKAKIYKFRRLADCRCKPYYYKIIDQIVVILPLIPLNEPTNQRCLVFYIVKYIDLKETFCSNDTLPKHIKAYKIIFKQVFNQPILDLVSDFMDRKRYSCDLLLESIILSSDICLRIKDALKKAFKYKLYDHKLKIDILNSRKVLITQ